MLDGMLKPHKSEMSPTSFSHAAFSDDDLAASEKKPLHVPTEPSELLQWLQEQGKRLKTLQNVLCSFLETGDTALLEPFATTKEFPKVTLKEPIREPVALFNHKYFLAHVPDGEDFLKQRNEDIKRLFPNVVIKEVKTADGEPRTAYIGAETKDIVAALDLCSEERKLARGIEQGRKTLGIAAMRLDLTVEQSPTSEKPTSCDAAVTPLPGHKQTSAATRRR